MGQTYLLEDPPIGLRLVLLTEHGASAQTATLAPPRGHRQEHLLHSGHTVTHQPQVELGSLGHRPDADRRLCRIYDAGLETG